MGAYSWFTEEDEGKVQPAAEKEWGSPIPCRQVSTGEFMPLPQTPKQKEYEARTKALADELAKKHGLDRRQFLRTASGFAAAFVTMNEVYGNIFTVNPAEAADPEVAKARQVALKNQFIFDDQTHHVSDNYQWEGVLFLRDFAAGNNPMKKPLNPALIGKAPKMSDYKFEAYLKDMFLDSDTTVSLLSGFTSDATEKEPLTNDQITQSRDMVNKLAGTRRMFAHGLFAPGRPGYLEEMERAATVLKVDSWKGYTVGDPLGPSRLPWRLDDEKLAYPAYRIAEKHGIRNICIHKGLIPADYKSFKNWQFANVDDLGKAAQDWPQLNFIIYHAALRPGFDYLEAEKEFESTGKIPWVDDLAEIRGKYGVDNVYPEIGSAFGTTVITHPRLAAGMLGRLIKGCGYDHICWGTDSVWYGSPQWQIEAFRRLEIPDDMRKKHGFELLGAETGKVKSTILGYTNARLYGLSLMADGTPLERYDRDGIARVKAPYREMGGLPDNIRYGCVRRDDNVSA